MFSSPSLSLSLSLFLLPFIFFTLLRFIEETRARKEGENNNEDKLTMIS
jgi:hypothetical protein